MARAHLFGGLITSCFISMISFAEGCSNGCSGHGTCGDVDVDGRDICTCEASWNGAPDCSLRTCPTGPAWADAATATDVAHNYAECSNMGTCDTETGQCICENGFEGTACERMACPTGSGTGSTSSSVYNYVCSNHGKCLSMREAAALRDDISLFTQTTYTSTWDADRIFGCVCDEGYTGYDCSLIECPKGFNSLRGVLTNEVQIVNCLCQTTCSGSLALQFKDKVAYVPHDADSALIEEILERAWPSAGQLSVSFSGGATLCENDGSSTLVEFTTIGGAIPPIRTPTSSTLSSDAVTPTVSVSAGGAAGVYGGVSVTTDKPATECSNRGTCESATGTCTCLTEDADDGGTYISSDGNGGAGTINDCGLVSVTPTSCPKTLVDGVATACSGRGTCDGATFECTCNVGYTGIDCSLSACPTGTPWFEEASAADTAHSGLVACSGVGICDTSAGSCTCDSRFTGDACEKLACPGESSSNTCSGHGTCYDMASLALLSESNGELIGATYGDSGTTATWDRNSVRGCYCDKASYHGPLDGDVSDYINYDCSKLTCPTGDNPATVGQFNEIQTINCVATGGTFTLTFRDAVTAAINYNADQTTVQSAIESLATIDAATVTFSPDAEACDADGNLITIEFTRNPGNLPTMTMDTTLLTSPQVYHSTSREGTTEDIECSGQGRCDRTTGVCYCYDAYTSSNGSGDGSTVGRRGDCGAQNIFLKHVHNIQGAI